MLAVITILVGIALLVFFIRTGRRNRVVYRKKVAPPDRRYSVNDHSRIFGAPSNTDLSGQSSSETASYGSFAFEDSDFGNTGEGDPFGFSGGDFGGAGGGDTYGYSDGNGGTNDSGPSEYSAGDSGSGDPGSDPCSDSSASDPSGFSSD